MWSWLKPTRIFAKKRLFHETEVYSDLDQFLETPLTFKLHGKVHSLKPVTTKEFYQLTNAMAGLYELQDKAKDQKEFSSEELVDVYYKIVSSLCDTITRKDIQRCTQAQIAGLYNVILDHAMGKGHNLTTEEVKKKTVATLNQASIESA